ncbi:MAG: sulfatase-like hydrolase/transferase [Pirellulaceae bacterium]
MNNKLVGYGISLLILAVFPFSGCANEPESFSYTPIASTTSRQLPIAVTAYRSPLLHQSQISGGQSQPNIILINVDDADRDSVEIDFRRDLPETMFPNLVSLANGGFRFDNVHCPSPLCGPSRASLLTGQYPHKTGIRANSSDVVNCRGVDGGFDFYRKHGPFRDSGLSYVNDDLGVWMRAAGYNTMLIGKYLHDDFTPEVGEHWSDIWPIGWENFYYSLGNRYYDFYQYQNGKVISSSTFDQEQFPNPYRTAIETNQALNLIDAHVSEQDGRPFFLYLAPISPHIESSDQRDPEELLPNMGIVDNSYKFDWPDLVQETGPDFNEEDVSDKPREIANLLPLTDTGEGYYENDFWAMNLEYRRRLLSLKSVDDMVGAIREKLVETGLANDTIIIFTSDNGHSLGQQRHYAKALPYDRITNIPMLVWGPGYFSGAEFHKHLISQVDIAPTILEMAGAPIPEAVQGKSFLPILDGSESGPPAAWRPEGVLVEHWQRIEERHGQQIEATFKTLRLHDVSYTEWANGDREYYKLSNDPLQLRNKYDLLSDSFRGVLNHRLQRLMREQVRPESFIERPFTSQDVFFQNVKLSGVAECRGGVGEVRLFISDITEPGQIRFWNGSEWLKPQNLFWQTLRSQRMRSRIGRIILIPNQTRNASFALLFAACQTPVSSNKR